MQGTPDGSTASPAIIKKLGRSLSNTVGQRTPPDLADATPPLPQVAMDRRNSANAHGHPGRRRLDRD